MRRALRFGMAAVVVAVTFFGAPRVRAAGPSYSMTPTSGPAGTVISVDGRDWIGPPGVTEVVFLQFGSDEEINGVNGRPGTGALSAVATPDKTGTFHLDVDTGHYTGSCAGGGCLVCVADSHILPICLGFILSTGPAPAPGAACPATPQATLSLPASHTLAPGQSADYTAGGFRVGAQVTVQLTGPAGSGPPVQATADASCAMQATIAIPPNGPPGTYTVTASGTTPSGGTRTWTTTFQVSGTAQAPTTPAAPEPTGDEMASAPDEPAAPDPPAAPSTLARDCSAADAAFDEAFLRWEATRLALERERNLHSLLDHAHEDLRLSIFKGAAVDVLALAPGWPLSSGVASAFFDAEKQKLANALLNAGLKSVETRIAKDQSLAGVGDQLTKLDLSTGLPIEGATADVGWEGVKTGLEGAMGKAAADTSFFAFDLLKFGLSTYEGWNQLDASRDMLRRVNEHISHLLALDGELSAVIADAKSAQAYCQQQIADRRPFDTNDPALNRVRDYLGE